MLVKPKVMGKAKGEKNDVWKVLTFKVSLLEGQNG
jgi:hypothetical protein